MSVIAFVCVIVFVIGVFFSELASRSRREPASLLQHEMLARCPVRVISDRATPRHCLPMSALTPIATRILQRRDRSLCADCVAKVVLHR